jgi:nucleoside-diphosphate-sugar epimerase
MIVPDLRGKRVLVTGATGFLGQHLVPQLLAAGAEVTVWQHQNQIPLAWAQCRTVKGEIEGAALRSAILESAAMYHLAAFVPPNTEDPAHAARCLEANALLTLKLAEIARQNPRLRLVYFSMGQGYEVSGCRAARESDALYPAARAAYYLSSKLLGEIFVERVRREQGLPWISLRIGCCYGTGMRPTSAIPAFIKAAHRGSTLRVEHGGLPGCDYVHVSDVVSAGLKAFNADGSGIYNVGCGVASSLLDLAKAVVAVFNSNSKIDIIPAKGHPPASFAALDCSKAAATWGYQPLTLKQGLEKMKAEMGG